MSKTALWSMVAVAVIIAAIVLAIIFIPGGSNTTKNKSASAGAAKEAAQIKEIKTNFMTFFAAATPMQTREALLENGAQFAQPMQAEFAQLNAERPSVSINSVKLTSAKSAAVVYSVELNSQPVLTNQSGGALLIDNTWKVSDATLCQLFALGGQKPAVCNNVK